MRSQLFSGLLLDNLPGRANGHEDKGNIKLGDADNFVHADVQRLIITGAFD